MPQLTDQQCAVYHPFKCDQCDAGYVIYTCGHRSVPTGQEPITWSLQLPPYSCHSDFTDRSIFSLNSEARE